MTEPLQISAFIIAQNEAHRIGATIDSLKGLVSEIIVVDSGSTDGTQDLCTGHGAKVIHNDWPGYGPQKRFAEDQCQHDWLLNLDADEVLSPEIIADIRSAFSTSPDADGFIFAIKDCLPGEARPRRFAHTTRAVRLYDKRKGRYVDSTVHDRVKFSDTTPNTKPLKGLVWHYSVVSLGQFVDKLNKYSTAQAEDMAARGRVPGALTLRLLFEFPLSFLKYYILRGDIMRGRRGFIHSMAYAFHRFARIAKVWEGVHDKPRSKPGRG